MYCLVVYVDMNSEGGQVVRVWLSGEICGVLSCSVEHFVKKHLTVHAYCARVLFTESMSVRPLYG